MWGSDSLLAPVCYQPSLPSDMHAFLLVFHLFSLLAYTKPESEAGEGRSSKQNGYEAIFSETKLGCFWVQSGYEASLLQPSVALYPSQASSGAA